MENPGRQGLGRLVKILTWILLLVLNRIRVNERSSLLVLLLGRRTSLEILETHSSSFCFFVSFCVACVLGGYGGCGVWWLGWVGCGQRLRKEISLVWLFVLPLGIILELNQSLLLLLSNQNSPVLQRKGKVKPCHSASKDRLRHRLSHSLSLLSAGGAPTIRQCFVAQRTSAQLLLKALGLN